MSLIISPLEKLMASENDTQKQYTYQIMYRNANRIFAPHESTDGYTKIERGK